MKVGHKIFLFAFVLLMSVSFSEAATIAGGKYFHGQNFTSSIGGQFKVYGADPYKIFNNYTGSMELHYRRAVVMSDIDETVTILNGTCESTTKYKYCYKGSSINLNDEKTFQDGYMQGVMQITIDSLPPSTSVITFTRNSSIKAYCGEIINVPIVVMNGGTVITNISYTEILPINTVIISSTNGVVNENIITFRDRILANTSKTYSYNMINLDCQPKKWIAQYNFTTLNNSLVSKNITSLNITIQTAYFVNETLSKNKTNDPWNETIYTWKITNNHTSIDLQLNITIIIPNSTITDKSLGIMKSGNVYQYAGALPVNKTLTLYIKFYEEGYGNYTVKNSGIISINDHELEYNSSKTLQVLQPIVNVYMDINNTVNKSTTIILWARNDDLTSKYYYLYGILKGIGDEEPFNYNVIEPGSTILVGKKVYNTTNLGIQDVRLVFDGVYRDRDNVDHKLYLEQNITINVPNIIKSNNTVNISANKTLPVKIVTGSNATSKGNKTTTVNPEETTATGAEKKKDVLTRAIEALSEFLQAIFG